MRDERHTSVEPEFQGWMEATLLWLPAAYALVEFVRPFFGDYIPSEEFLWSCGTAFMTTD